jgi:pimeloyl-ACP methyl ester carboxylesterase
VRLGPSTLESEPNVNFVRRIWVLAALCLLPVTTALAVDRLFLTPACPACHAEMTELLPLFDGSQRGLVRIRANSMEFRARVAGFDNRDGEGVILLHGFPETSIMWEPLLDKLSDAGFRVVAFDQRGYSPGARPFMQNDYTQGKLATDVLAVADTVGFKTFHIVGHDFGGALAWFVADRYPQRVISLTSLSTPHPAALNEALGAARPQWLRSSYVLFYRMPVLPEIVLGFNQAAYLGYLKWQEHPPEQRDEYRRVFSEPGALRATLNWYRAFEFRSLDPLGMIQVPTLFIWGRRDGAFSRDATIKTANRMDAPYQLHRVNAGHFLMLEVPDLVAEQLLAHLKNWKRITKQWNAAIPDTPRCDQSRPDCLRISVAPDGSMLRVRNRCEASQRGVIRVFCTAWAPEAYAEYRFDLGANAEMTQASHGVASGDCYYRHRLCPGDSPDVPSQRAGTD